MNFDDWKAWSWHTLTGISSFQPQLITLIYWSLKLFFQLIWYTDVLLQKKYIPKLWSVWWNLSIIFLIFQCRYVQFGPSMIVRGNPQEAKPRAHCSRRVTKVVRTVSVCFYGISRFCHQLQYLLSLDSGAMCRGGFLLLLLKWLVQALMLWLFLKYIIQWIYLFYRIPLER